jgi:L-rhamnonate dehydratase
VDHARIVRIEWAPLVGERPRSAGPNAHMGAHGRIVRVPIARVTLDDESSGFGWSRVDEPTARALLESTHLFDEAAGVSPRGHPIEGPLWDLMGRRAGLPVYALTTRITGAPTPTEAVRVPCYDTTLYFDDLHLADDEAAAALMADEARQGFERGHRAFKIKVGRGNLHMPTGAGLRRDVAVVKAVRAAVGPDVPIMTDANNGYTFNLAREFLAETADVGVTWLEEAFWEDPILYRRLQGWLRAEGLSTLIADGEGRPVVDPYTAIVAEGLAESKAGRVEPSALLLEMAREGLVDVVQYDVWDPGITRWLQVGPMLDGWGRRSAPHHYGTLFGNYASAHLGPAIRGFMFVEWDAAQTPALAAPGYRIADGHVEVPPTPGFGLELDEDTFLGAVRAEGFSVGG